MAFLSGDRRLVRVVRPERAEHGAAFTALRFDREALGDEGDPFINIDHFRMAGLTFPPHAHAGFSAITYVLPESEGTMRNRDGRGGLHHILQAGLHWTAAGAGLMHEEVPATMGTPVEGMQIFVRQPAADETAEARVIHIKPQDVPEITLPQGGTARLLAGHYEAQNAPFEPPSELVLLDISLPVSGALHWPDTTPHASPAMPRGGGFALYLFVGEVDLGEAYGDLRRVTAPALMIFAEGEGDMQLRALAASRLLVLAGTPLRLPHCSNGPFVLSSQAALLDSVERFRSGGMGRIDGPWPDEVGG